MATATGEKAMVKVIGKVAKAIGTTLVGVTMRVVARGGALDPSLAHVPAHDG